MLSQWLCAGFSILESAELFGVYTEWCGKIAQKCLVDDRGQRKILTTSPPLVFFQSLGVHFWWACELRFLFLADRSEIWCGLMCFSSTSTCAFGKAFLLTTIVMSAFSLPIRAGLYSPWRLIIDIIWTSVHKRGVLRLWTLVVLMLYVSVNKGPPCQRNLCLRLTPTHRRTHTIQSLTITLKCELTNYHGILVYMSMLTRVFMVTHIGQGSHPNCAPVLHPGFPNKATKLLNELLAIVKITRSNSEKRNKLNKQTI